MSYIGSTPTSQNFISGTDYFNGTGSQTAFTLTRSVNSVNDIEVVVNNVIQQPSGYTVSGTTLTLSAAPSSGTSNVYVRYLATNQQSFTVGNNTVGYNQLTSDMQSKFAMKNRIINGAMVINQRAGGTVTGNDGVFGVDRWKASCVPDGKFTMQQSSTAPAGYINSLLVTSTSAYSVGSTDFVGIRQDIEGLNCTDLGWGTASAKTITLSFQVYSSLTGTFGGSLFNNAANRSYPFSFTISAANTWTTISVTIAGDTTGTWLTTNGRGICVFFNLGTGSTYSGTANTWANTFYAAPTGATSVVGTNGATFYITGVQLEVGSSATGFEYRQYQQELALCQRYCPAWTFSGSYTSVALGLSPGSTGVYAFLPYPVTPRVVATGITTTGTFVGITPTYGVGGAGTLAISSYGNSGNLGLVLSGSSGLTSGAASYIACVATGTLIATGCEL